MGISRAFYRPLEPSQNRCFAGAARSFRWARPPLAHRNSTTANNWLEQSFLQRTPILNWILRKLIVCHRVNENLPLARWMFNVRYFCSCSAFFSILVLCLLLSEKIISLATKNLTKILTNLLKRPFPCISAACAMNSAANRNFRGAAWNSICRRKPGALIITHCPVDIDVPVKHKLCDTKIIIPRQAFCLPNSKWGHGWTLSRASCTPSFRSRPFSFST